jgi:WD40 repeat protein
MVKDHLVFASYEREILVFDWKKKEQIQSLETGNKCASTLNSYSCVHGDRMAAIADEDMTIKVWKLDSNYERFDPEASLFAAQVMERWTDVTIDAETLTGLTKAVTGQRCIRRFSLLNGTEESTIRVDVGEGGCQD